MACKLMERLIKKKKKEGKLVDRQEHQQTTPVPPPRNHVGDSPTGRPNVRKVDGIYFIQKVQLSLIIALILSGPTLGSSEGGEDLLNS